jgi:OHCU decarboxylase
VINADRSARVEGSHWIGEMNFAPEVTAQFDFPAPLALIDSTLRKSRYTAGAVTSVDGFLRMAAALDDIGVQHESLNLDWWGEKTPNARELELCAAIAGGGFSFVTNIYADTLLGNGAAPMPVDPRSAVDVLVGIGAKVMAPGIVPAPDAAAEARQMEQLAEIVNYAATGGLTFTITLAQIGRRDFPAMLRVANQAIELGAARIDLMDSTSSLGPEALRHFVRSFRVGLATAVPLTMHAHDDFGMATASAIAAATAGASPDVSVNGVSYRCGFAALEEVVLSLEVLYGVDTGIQVDKLQALSELVARESGVPVGPLKPVIGGYAFLKHTPNDVLAALRDPEAFPPISGCVSASVIGSHVGWVWDRLSTRAMARQLASNLGAHDLSDAEVETVYMALDAAVTARSEYPGWLEPADAALICLNQLSPPAAAQALAPCCRWDMWGPELAQARPFSGLDALQHAAESLLDGLPDAELVEVLNLYAPIGAATVHAPIGAAPDGTGQAEAWSQGEESGIGAERADLLEFGERYRTRFGFTFLIAAAGLSGAQILAQLKQRLANEPAQELVISRDQLRVKVVKRLRRLLGAPE